MGYGGVGGSGRMCWFGRGSGSCAGGCARVHSAAAYKQSSCSTAISSIILDPCSCQGMQPCLVYSDHLPDKLSRMSRFSMDPRSADQIIVQHGGFTALNVHFPTTHINTTSHPYAMQTLFKQCQASYRCISYQQVYNTSTRTTRNHRQFKQVQVQAQLARPAQ